MALRLPDRNFELRVSNNLASAMSDDEPAEATQMTLEAMELARRLGSRGMYNFLVGTSATGLHDDGHDWEPHTAVMREALETATIRSDRIRIRGLIALLETPRGLHLDEGAAEITEMVGDSTDPDDLFTLHMARAGAALVTGDTQAAFDHALAATQTATQNAEVGYAGMLRAAIWARDLERARAAAAGISEVPATGAFMRAMRTHAAAAVAALEGRTSDAVAHFGEARTSLLEMEQHFVAAALVVDAAILLPGHPDVRSWAAEARARLELLDARPYLDKLDEALATSPPPAAAPAEARTAQTPTA